MNASPAGASRRSAAAFGERHLDRAAPPADHARQLREAPLGEQEEGRTGRVPLVERDLQLDVNGRPHPGARSART